MNATRTSAPIEDEAHDPMTGHEKGRQSLSWRRFLPPVILVLLLVAAWRTGVLDQFSLSGFIRHREWLAGFVDANFLAALAIYFAIYAALVAISFPGASLLTLASGFLFGGLAGGTVTVFAATAGATAVFLVARSSFGKLLEARAQGFAAKLAEGFREDAFLYLLSLRLTPIFPFWVVNIVPALLGMRAAPYALATFLGIIPGTFAFAFVGAGLGSVIDAQERPDPGCAAAGTCAIDVSGLLTPQIIAAFAAFGLVALMPPVLRRLGFLSRKG